VNEQPIEIVDLIQHRNKYNERNEAFGKHRIVSRWDSPAKSA
jgi:hypothetical protein